MSVASITDQFGRIIPQALDTSQAPFTNFISNPLTSNLNCGTIYAVDDAARMRTSLLQTDQITTIPGSLVLKVQVNSDMELLNNKELFFNGDAVINTNQDFQINQLNPAPTGLATIMSYDPISHNVYYQTGGGGSAGMTGPTGPTGSSATASNWAQYAANTGPINFSNYALSNCGNITLVDSSINLTSAFFADRQEIVGLKALRSDIDTGLIIQAKGTTNGLRFFVNDFERVSINQGGVMTFLQTPPQCSFAPSASNDLTNKLYVDGQVQSKPTSVFYVSKQGNDSNNGSILKPFLTIQQAINSAEAISSSANPVTINVAIGTYTENLTFSKGYVAVCGTAENQYANITLPRISGSVTVNVGTSDDLYGRVVALQGLLISGSISDTSAYQHTLSIKNCYINGSGSARAINQASSATDARTYVMNTQIENNSNFPAIECTTGWLNMQFCDVTQNNNQPVLSIQSAGLLVQMLGCILTATHTGSQPICVIIPSSGTHTISNSSFIYTDATGKVDGTSNGIQLATPNTLQLVFCYFILTGTSAGSGLAVGGSGTVVRGNSVGLYGHKITGPLSVALNTVS